jgi:hypothetical protein
MALLEQSGRDEGQRPPTRLFTCFSIIMKHDVEAKTKGNDKQRIPEKEHQERVQHLIIRTWDKNELTKKKNNVASNKNIQ